MGGKFDSDDFVESGNWNVAQKYSNLIMDHLLNLTKYEGIAQFGIPEFEHQFEVSPEMSAKARISAVKWFANELLMLIRATTFAIKTPGDKTELEKHKKKVMEFRKYIPLMEIRKIDHGKKTNVVIVDEKVFDMVMPSLVELKEKILIPLNNSDLIFTSIEEFDIEKITAEKMKKLAGEG